MTKEERLTALSEYIERAKQMLELSSPAISSINSSEEYRLALQESFRKIGDLSVLNGNTLECYLFPLLEPGRELSEEDIAAMKEFSSMLGDTTSMESIDMPLIYMQAQILFDKAKESGDTRDLIIASDRMVCACYMMINLSIRLSPATDVCRCYQQKGLEAAAILIDHLEPGKFAALPDDECRELVLINSRYTRCLYEWETGNEQFSDYKKELEILRKSLALANEPSYTEIMSDYDWDNHVFRTLQYLADFTEDNNSHRFTHDQLVEIYDYTKQLKDLLDKHPKYKANCPDIERADSEGRSYKEGRSMHELVKEFREGRGSRYAPYVVDLLDNPELRAGLYELLTTGRDENCRAAFRLLKVL